MVKTFENLPGNRMANDLETSVSIVACDINVDLKKQLNELL